VSIAIALLPDHGLTFPNAVREGLSTVSFAPQNASKTGTLALLLADLNHTI